MLIHLFYCRESNRREVSSSLDVHATCLLLQYHNFPYIRAHIPDTKGYKKFCPVLKCFDPGIFMFYLLDMTTIPPNSRWFYSVVAVFLLCLTRKFFESLPRVPACLLLFKVLNPHGK